MIGSIIILIVLAIIVFFIVRHMIHNVKKGKGLDGGCGGDCSKCGGCH